MDTHIKEMKTSAITIFSAALSLNAAAETPCVKIRSENGSACMKFSDSEIKNAAKYGLRLADPFSAAKKKLLQQGWRIDPSNPEPTCGRGWDAMCSATFKRGSEVLLLSMSGTSEGMPLTQIVPEE